MPELDRGDFPTIELRQIQFLGTAQMITRANTLFFRASLRYWRHAIWPAQQIKQVLEAVSRGAPLRADRRSSA